jgi:SAM-dependent methyltransferase
VSVMKEWTDEQILNYYLGIEHSDYPRVFWEAMRPHLDGCTSLIDIGCGPGAFALAAARDGFHVQAVDISKKNLDALQGRIKELGLKKVKLIYGDWLEVEAEKSDVAVCAYSFGGTIGTARGLKKIFEIAGKAAFLISPYSSVQTDFLTEELYVKMGIAPPSFSGDYRDLLHLLQNQGKEVECKIIEYDFGMPLASRDELDNCVFYMGEKLGLPPTDLLKEHLQKIITTRNGLCWVPNPRKSAMIIWKGRSETVDND